MTLARAVQAGRRRKPKLSNCCFRPSFVCISLGKALPLSTCLQMAQRPPKRSTAPSASVPKMSAGKGKKKKGRSEGTREEVHARDPQRKITAGETRGWVGLRCVALALLEAVSPASSKWSPVSGETSSHSRTLIAMQVPADLPVPTATNCNDQMIPAQPPLTSWLHTASVRVCLVGGGPGGRHLPASLSSRGPMSCSFPSSCSLPAPCFFEPRAPVSHSGVGAGAGVHMSWC